MLAGRQGLMDLMYGGGTAQNLELGADPYYAQVRSLLGKDYQTKPSELFLRTMSQPTLSQISPYARKGMLDIIESRVARQALAGATDPLRTGFEYWGAPSRLRDEQQEFAGFGDRSMELPPNRNPWFGL